MQAPTAEPTYRYLFAMAVEHAHNAKVPSQRVPQFAAEYADTFQGKDWQDILSPESFREVAHAMDYHFGGEQASG